MGNMFGRWFDLFFPQRFASGALVGVGGIIMDRDDGRLILMSLNADWAVGLVRDSGLLFCYGHRDKRLRLMEFKGQLPEQDGGAVLRQMLGRFRYSVVAESEGLRHELRVLGRSPTVVFGKFTTARGGNPGTVVWFLWNADGSVIHTLRFCPNDEALSEVARCAFRVEDPASVSDDSPTDRGIFEWI